LFRCHFFVFMFLFEIPDYLDAFIFLCHTSRPPLTRDPYTAKIGQFFLPTGAWAPPFRGNNNLVFFVFEDSLYPSLFSWWKGWSGFICFNMMAPQRRWGGMPYFPKADAPIFALQARSTPLRPKIDWAIFDPAKCPDIRLSCGLQKWKHLAIHRKRNLCVHRNSAQAFVFCGENVSVRYTAGDGTTQAIDALVPHPWYPEWYRFLSGLQESVMLCWESWPSS